MAGRGEGRIPVRAAYLPGTLPRRLEALLAELARFVLPERRPRRYPRAVKIKMSNYPRNRPHRRRSRAKCLPLKAGCQAR